MTRVDGSVHGRFISPDGYRVARGTFGHYELVVLNAHGLPVMPLTVWYRLRTEPGKEGTRDAYLARLRPLFAHWEATGRRWDDPPADVEAHVLAYLQERLRVRVDRDDYLGGYRTELTTRSPITPSGLRQVTAAIRDFYRVMLDRGYYPYHQNPMVSPLLEGLRRVKVEAVLKGDLPMGVNDLFAPTAVFRQKRREGWEIDPRRSQGRALLGLADAIDWMTALPLSAPTRKRRPGRRARTAISRRDRAILLLLRYCGARLNEVCRMTVGGYRGFNRDKGAPLVIQVPLGRDTDGCEQHSVLHKVVLRDKGSGGREVKPAWIPRCVQDALQDYLANERPLHDGAGRLLLASLDDDEPFFLTETGAPYSKQAFMKHWYRLYPLVAAHCPLHFTVHSIRHLFVTDHLLFLRRECGGTDGMYPERRQAFARTVMHWAHPRTIDVYDHSINELDTLGLLARYQETIGRGEEAGEWGVDKVSAAPPLAVDDNREDEVDGVAWFIQQSEGYRADRS